MNVPETYEDDNYGILFERRSLMEDESAYQSAKLSMLPLMKQDEYNEKLLGRGRQPRNFLQPGRPQGLQTGQIDDRLIRISGGVPRMRRASFLFSEPFMALFPGIFGIGYEIGTVFSPNCQFSYLFS